MNAVADCFKFIKLDDSDYQSIGLHPAHARWMALKNSYEDLPTDEYLPNGETYRRRRFGRYYYSGTNDVLEPLEHAPFYQSSAYNKLSGGIYRDFAPLTAETQHNTALHQLIRFHAERCIASQPEILDWHVYVHQIRIVGNNGMVGKPTPEGLHQDGHYFIAQILVSRENVSGAETLLYDSARRLIHRATLLKSMDTFFINDRSVLHEATPLYGIDKEQPAFRDMLLIDFNPAT